MGREIRRVPPNWSHPVHDYCRHRTPCNPCYKPMYDAPFAPRMDEWYGDWKKWEAGERPAEAVSETYWEWNGGPPDPDYYRPDWPEWSATWFQMYETVSEGTPVSPPFATKAELADYLVEHGDFWDQRGGNGGWTRENAERFVSFEWAPTFIVRAAPPASRKEGAP